MITHNLRAFAYVIFGLWAATYGIIFYITQDLSSIDWIKAFSSVGSAIGLNIIIWVVFVKWAWKLNFFYPWLVQIPDLSGKWEGFTKQKKAGKETDLIGTVVQIKQDFFNTQIKAQTGESKSFSISASFDIDKARGQEQLIYTYLNTPDISVRDRSAMHYGSVLLAFEGYAVSELAGHYWTDRQSIGEIHLNKVS